MHFRVNWLRAVTTALVLASTPVLVAVAHAANKAAIVMDMRNGHVIYADEPDRRQAPASLTKMMTLYLTFEAVRDGRLDLDQKLRVSRHAARMPATKLYLKPGQRVKVRDLIRAAAIKSANDAAVVLAEGIGGSERAFARLMTRKARELGMKNTVFKNSNGLPHRGHVSTVRDMAILARHLYFDFPEYYNIFGRVDGYAAGKHIWNTNRLLTAYDGVDGIKTGYTHAAGYNLAASAERGNERILVVVFGESSSASRNKHVERLLDLGFKEAPSSVRRVPPRGPEVLMVSAPVPPERPGGDESGLAALAEAFVPSAEAATPPAAPILSPFAPARADRPAPRSGREGAGSRVAAGQAPIPEPRPSRDSRSAWAAEVGPYSTETAALVSLADITSGLAGDAAAGFRLHRSGGSGGSQVYSLHLAGLTQHSAARVCGTLSAQDLPCRLVREAR